MLFGKEVRWKRLFHPRPAALLKALKAVIHGGASVEEGERLYSSSD